MTGNLSQAGLERLHKLAAELDEQLQQMQPLLRQMHLLSSNAVSAAARAGSEGDAFRVLTQAIQQLGQDINADMQRSHTALLALAKAETMPSCRSLLKQVEDGLSMMPQAVKKGEYLAISSAVEAAHAENHSDSFDSVATMLKQLIANLRQQVARQQDMLSGMQELI